jgi:hypothetical protein
LDARKKRSSLEKKKKKRKRKVRDGTEVDLSNAWRI